MLLLTILLYILGGLSLLVFITDAWLSMRRRIGQLESRISALEQQQNQRQSPAIVQHVDDCDREFQV